MLLEKYKKIIRKTIIYLFFTFAFLTLCGVLFVTLYPVTEYVASFIVLLGVVGYLVTLGITKYIFNQYLVQTEKMENQLNTKIKDQLAHIKQQQQHLVNQSKFAAMGEMLAMIAHQWRQPLNVISLHLTSIHTMINSKKVKMDEFNQHVDDISHSIEYMSKTIDDFRDFLKKDEKLEKIAVLDLVYKPKHLVEVQLKKHNIDFQFEYTIDPEEEITIDKSKFFQVIMNLYKNAIDQLVDKSVKEPFIKVSLQAKSNSLVFQVEDNAGGIPDDIMEKVFNPYFSTKGKNGTGLGLYMSKRIIEEYSGGIMVVENTDQGACFTIMIPFTKEEDNDFGTLKTFHCFSWNKEKAMFEKQNTEDKECHLRETKEIVNMLNHFSISYTITDNYDIKVKI